MKLTTTQKRLLFEAYRRNRLPGSHEGLSGGSLRTRWLGLGTAAAYKSMLREGYMTFHDGRTPPRCMGWLVLTTAGIRLLWHNRHALRRMHRAYLGTAEGRHFTSQYELWGGFRK